MRALEEREGTGVSIMGEIQRARAAPRDVRERERYHEADIVVVNEDDGNSSVTLQEAPRTKSFVWLSRHHVFLTARTTS